MFSSAIICNGALFNEVLLIVSGKGVPDRGLRVHLQQKVSPGRRHQIAALAVGQFELILDGVQVSG